MIVFPKKDGLFTHCGGYNKFYTGEPKGYTTRRVDPALQILCDSINKNKEVAGLLCCVEGDTSSYAPDYSTDFVFGVLSLAKILLTNLCGCIDIQLKKNGVIRKTILNGIPFSDRVKKRIEKLPLDTTTKDLFECFKNKNNNVGGLRFYNNGGDLSGAYISYRKIYEILSNLEVVGSDDHSLMFAQNAIKEIDEVLNIMKSHYCRGVIYTEIDLGACFAEHDAKVREQVIKELKEAEAMEDKVLMACDPELVGLVDELASYAVLTHKYARTLTSSINDALIRDAFKEAGFVKYEKYQQVTIQGKRLRNIYYDPLRFNGEPSLWQLGFYLNKSVGVNHKVGEAEAMADNTQTLTINRPKQQENKLLTVGNKKAYTVGNGDYKHRNGVIKDGCVIKEEKAEMNKVYTYPVGDKNILADLEDLLNNIIDNPDTVDNLVNYLEKNAPAAHFISEMIGCGEVDNEESLIGALNKATSVSQGMVAAGKNVHIQGGEYKVYNYLNVDYPKPIFGREFSLKQLSFCFDVAAREIEDIFVKAKAEEEAEEAFEEIIADAAQAQAKEIEDILDGAEAEEEKEEVMPDEAVQEHAEEDCEEYPADLEELQKLLEERRKKEAELDAEIKQAEEEARRKELVEQLLAADNRIKEKEERLAQLRKK